MDARRTGRYAAVLAFVLALSFCLSSRVLAETLVTDDQNYQGLYEIRNAKDIFTKGPYVDVRAYASFSAAIDAIGTDLKTLLIPCLLGVMADKTVPANVTLLFLEGGSLSISGGVTVTINGPLVAGSYQIFTGMGEGGVRFGSGSVQEAYPDWWTTNTTPGTTDMYAAIYYAFLSGAPNVVIGDNMSVSSGITRPTGVSIKGKGTGLTKIVYNGAAGSDFVTSTVGGDRGGIFDLELDGNSLARDGLVVLRSWYTQAERVWVHGCQRDGLVLMGDNNAPTRGAYYNSAKDILSIGNGRYGVNIDTAAGGIGRANANTLVNVSSQGNLAGGFYVGTAVLNTIIGGTAEMNGLSTTSSTSLTVGTGSKTLTIGTGLGIVSGSVVKIYRTSQPVTTWMFGTITSYNSGTGSLVANIDTTLGSGTYTDWSVNQGAGVIFSSASVGCTIIGMDSEQNPVNLPMNLVFVGTAGNGAGNKVIGGSMGDETSIIYSGSTKDRTNICWAYTGQSTGRIEGALAFGRSVYPIDSPSGFVQEGRTTPTLGGTWVAYGGAYAAPNYWRDPNGNVHIEGAMKSGTIGSSTVFTLPSGYRPVATMGFAVASNNAFGQVIVGSDGTVKAQTGSNTRFEFNGVCFRTTN